jgi:hypothetical protein
MGTPKAMCSRKIPYEQDISKGMKSLRLVVFRAHILPLSVIELKYTCSSIHVEIPQGLDELAPA